MILVLTIAFVLLGIATPRLLETRSRVALPTARSQVTSAISVARAAATRYGRTSYLVLDVALDRVEVRVDTSEAGGQPPVSLHVSDLWSELRVDLQASYPIACFDPRGFAPTSLLCPGATVVARLVRDPLQDSVMISTTGRASQ